MKKPWHGYQAVANSQVGAGGAKRRGVMLFCSNLWRIVFGRTAML